MTARLPPDFTDLLAELQPLREIYPGRATKGYLRNLGRQIWILEKTGASHFGGPAVLAWWLVQRACAGETFMRLTSYVAQLYHERIRPNG